MLHADTNIGPVAATPQPTAAGKRRRVRSGVPRVALGLLVPGLLFAAWWLTAAKGWVAPQILPPPRRVGNTLLEQLSSGDLFGHMGISLGRVAAGFVLGSVIGAGLGVAMGLSRKAEDYLYPTFKAVSQVPVLGWLPLAMMLLGIGEALKVVIIAQACMIPVALNALKGIRSVPASYVEVARAFEYSRRQLLRKVIFPASVPTLFVGLRSGLTQAWLSLVTVELLASSEGLGFMIVWGRQLFQLDLVLSAIIIVGVVGLLLDKLLERVEAWLLRWRPSVQYGDQAAHGAAEDVS
ncbi:MAG: ABC transporter permease [Polyangiales bacterium]